MNFVEVGAGVVSSSFCSRLLLALLIVEREAVSKYGGDDGRCRPYQAIILGLLLRHDIVDGVLEVQRMEFYAKRTS